MCRYYFCCIFGTPGDFIFNACMFQIWAFKSSFSSFSFLINITLPAASHLHSGLRQADPQSQFLPHEDVRVVCFGEAPLQLVELRRREAGPVSLLFLGLLPSRLVGVVVAVVVVLLLLLLLFVLLFAVHLHRVGSPAAGDIVTREHRSPFHAVRARAELPGVSRVRSPTAEPAFQSLPVAQELRGILHPCTDNRSRWELHIKHLVYTGRKRNTLGKCSDIFKCTQQACLTCEKADLGAAEALFRLQ